MKKKNIVFIAASLDGYIAGKNGEIDWLHLVPNPDNIDMGFVGVMEEVDAVVMGRVTFDTVVGFGGEWPYSKHVFVLSRTLEAVPTELERQVTVVSGTPAEVLRTINDLGHVKLYIDGGSTIQQFLKEDLVDELIITTIPILLGGGFSLFGELEQPLPLCLADTKVYLDQMIQSKYVRAKK